MPAKLSIRRALEGLSRHRELNVVTPAIESYSRILAIDPKNKKAIDARDMVGRFNELVKCN